jgi:DNA polymerase-3 subunit delta
VKLQPEKVIKSPIVMISGDESVLRREALEEVLKAAEIAPDDFDLQVMDGESPASDWIASAGTAPFLAARRTVVVRYLLRSDIDRAKDLTWKNLPDYALLVLVADEENGDDDKQRRLKTARTNWEKLIKSAGGEVIDCKYDPRDLKSTIKVCADKLEKKITDRAVDTLLEMSAGNGSRAIEELDKLALYIGEEKTIQEADVRALVVPSREWNVFKMVDAVVDGDVATAMRQLRTLVGSTSKAEEHAFRSILPMMSRALRLIWQARVCLDARVDPTNAPDHIRAAFMPKPNIATEGDFARNKAMRAARNVNLRQLAEMLQLASDCDSRLKGLLPSFSGMETLEQTLLRMVAVVKPKVHA